MASVRFGNSWGDWQNVSVKQGGVWVDAQAVYVKKDGAWIQFFGNGNIPAEWTEVALSTAVEHPDGSTYDSGSGEWTFRGAGADLWVNNDRGVFIYQDFQDGDQLDAYIETMVLEGGGLNDLDQYAGVYLMVRETLEKDARHYSVGPNPNANRVQQKYRSSNGSGSTQEDNDNRSEDVPIYLRVVFSSGVLTSSYSYDGISYTQIGQTPSLTGVWKGGICIVSHDDSTPEYLIATGTLSKS